MPAPGRDLESDVLAGVVTWRDLWPALDERERALRADLERDLAREIVHLRGAIDGLTAGMTASLAEFRREVDDRRTSSRWWIATVIGLVGVAATLGGLLLATIPRP